MHRIDTLPGGVGQLVDRVVEKQIDYAALRLVAQALTITGVQLTPLASAASDQWTAGTNVVPPGPTAVASQRELLDVTAARQFRKGDTNGYLATMRRARAVAALAYGIADSGRTGLREVAYETAVALDSPAMVADLLRDYIET